MNLVLKVDSDGAGTLPSRGEAFFHDGEHTVLSFEDPILFDPIQPFLTYRYLFGPKLDQIFSQEEILAAQDKVFEMLGDDQWNVATILNGGTVVVQNTFDTFGNMTEVYNPGGVSYLFAYTGREWDPDSGLYYYRARWMDPSTGRFLSEDPIYYDANNPARYVGNNPTNFTDPTGEDAAITGGGDHVGIEVDVCDENGKVIGAFSTEFSADGFLNDDDETGGYGGIDVVWGAKGEITMFFFPNRAASGARKVAGNEARDNRMLEWALAQAGKDRAWLDLEVAAGKNKWREPAVGDFEKYRVCT